VFSSSPLAKVRYVGPEASSGVAEVGAYKAEAEKDKGQSA
jgi:hypothetical protein